MDSMTKQRREGEANRPRRAKTGQHSRQNLPVDALGAVWQVGAAMNGSEKQFSFTRAASSTSGRAKNQIPIRLVTRGAGITNGGETL